MILNHTFQFAFVHIPKCAGSSVKEQLRPLDEADGRYERAQPHPEYGRVHRAHLPLWLHAELYPDDFAALQTYTTYAVLRDPFARFGSALAQRLEQFFKIDPFALSESELRREIDTVVTFLQENPKSPQLEFCHFLPQVDFVDYADQRFVTELYRLQDVPVLMADIGARTGHSFLDHARANQKHNFKSPAIKSLAMRANALAKSVLPASAHAALKNRVADTLTQSGKGQVWSDVLASQMVQDFVQTYYRADIDLLDAAPHRTG